MDIGPGVSTTAAASGNAAQHRNRLAVDQATGGEAGDRVRQTVVGDGVAVGGDRGVDLVDGQTTVDEDQVVVAVRATGGMDVAACVSAAAAAGGNAAQHRNRLAVDQPAGGEAVDRMRQTVVGDGVAVGGDRGAGLVDTEAAIGEGEVVVAVDGVAGNRVDVAAHIGTGRPRCGRRNQHALVFAIDQTADSKAADALRQTVIGDDVTVTRNGRVGPVDGEAAVHEAEVVVTVGGVAADRVDVTANIDSGRPRCGWRTQYALRRLAIDQPAHGKTADALIQTVVGNVAAVARYDSVGPEDGGDCVGWGNQRVVASISA